jgi:hypothetical protein
MLDFLKNPILKRLLKSGVRAGLVALGSWLVTHGYASDQEAATLVTDLLPIVFALVWSAYEAAHVEKKIEVALQMPAGSSRESLSKVMKITD